MSASLVILAAGMGSRYGGLKQIDEFGPQGESLLEYAVYDALHAGFDHMVFIIRESFADAFREKFAAMLARCPRYDLIYQDMDPPFSHIEDVTLVVREKPWGTLHAMLCARDIIDQPFAVINADDRYGTGSYAMLYSALQDIEKEKALLVGYTLENTLSQYGTVNRGVCEATIFGALQNVQEHYKIGYDKEGNIRDREDTLFGGREIVSMNFRGFHQAFFQQAVPLLDIFVRAHAANPRAEMVIPDAVDVLVKQGNLTCRILPSTDGWQGVTNPEDKPKVQAAFQQMIADGMYPESLR